MAYKYDYSEKTAKSSTLQTNRSVWKLIIFNLLTCGLYSILFFIPFSFDLDTVAPKRDGTKTMNYLFAYVLSLFTCSIVITVWFYQITDRVEQALHKRRIDYDFGTKDFWLWGVFGTLVLVGNWIYMHKLCKAMNLLCESYNENPTLD